MRFIAARFDSPHALVAALDRQHSHHCLRYSPAGLRLKTGERLLVEIDVEGIPGRSLVHAMVGVAGPPATLWIDTTDAGTIDYLLQLADEADPDCRWVRRDTRVTQALQVDCMIEGYVPKMAQATTHDVSIGGTFIRSAAPPDVGAPMQLRFGPTVEGETFVVRGDVVRVNDDGFAVQFRTRTTGDAALLARHVAGER